MKKKLISVIIAITAVSIFSLQVGAYNSTGYATAKIYYKPGVQTTVANLEARIWFSVPQDMSIFNYKHKFNATSSSWAFNCSKPIRNHKNTQYLTVTGIDCSLTVSATPSVSVSTTKATATFTTPASNSYYRGINTYNNIADTSLIGSSIHIRTIDAYSKMQLLIDGQSFYNQGHCWCIDRFKYI